MQSILTNIRINFYSALLAQKIYDVTKESQSSAENNYKDTKLRYESGAASEYDLLQAEVRWRNSIPQTISAKKNYEQMLNMLKSELGIAIDEPLILTGSLETRPDFPDSLDTEQVLSQRGDYQALQLESDMRDKNVSLEFANHLPTIDGRFVYTNSAQSDLFKYENNFDNYVAGVSLNIPIYSGGNTSARVQKAELEHRQAEIRVEKAKDTIEMELTNALLNLKEARERITAAEKNEATARRAFEIAESRAENGLATQLELKDSRLLLDQANVTHLTAHFDYLKAYFEWQLITGNWEE
jgi:outer membrane protein TolC